jgi:hypothetical protein
MLASHSEYFGFKNIGIAPATDPNALMLGMCAVAPFSASILNCVFCAQGEKV